MSKIIAGAKAAIARLTRNPASPNLIFNFDSDTISTNAIYFGEMSAFGIKTGVSWATADVTVLVGMSEDDPAFVVLADADGTAYTQTSVAGPDARTIAAEIFPWQWIKLQSSVSQNTDVAMVMKG